MPGMHSVFGMLTTLLAGLLCGQPMQSSQTTAESTSAFEVASIKPLQSSSGPFHFNAFPGRLDVKNMNLRFLIEQAFDLPAFRVSGPDSMTSHHFDIVASATSSAPKPALKAISNSR
jgi:hypothetical protein